MSTVPIHALNFNQCLCRMDFMLYKHTLLLNISIVYAMLAIPDVGALGELGKFLFSLMGQ